MNLQDFCYQPHVGFEGRNQAYGAYELRKKYSKTLSTTLLVVVFSSATLFATPMIKRAFSPQEEIAAKDDSSIDPNVTVINLPPEPVEIKDTKPIVVIEPIKQPPVNQDIFQIIEIKDEKIDKKLTTNDELENKNSAISNQKQDGDGASNKPEETITDTKGELTKGLGDKEEEDNTVKEGFTVHQDASYEGGINKFREELQKKVMYPSLARKKGTEGTVYLQFVIEKNGSISNITVMKGIGDNCDEEAIKALEKMTALWAPAKDAKGKTVRVRKTIPIKFKMGN